MRHIIQCITFYLFTIQVIYSLSNGDICEDSRTKKIGFCKPILKCTQAIDDIKRGIFPITCGFLNLNHDPIICCLYEQNYTSPEKIKPSTTTPKKGIIFDDDEPTTTTILPVDEVISTEENISSKKCKEYAKFVYENRTSPILMIGHYVTVDTCVNSVVTSRSNFAKSREFPHSALIGYKYLYTKQWKCGGTLLNERHVLTSAQCTYSDTYGFARYVRVGISDFSDKNLQSHLQDINVLEIVKHPNYVEGTSHNDIALLKLETPAELSSFVRPACLPLSEKLSFKQILISGWGTVNFTENNDFVLKQQVLNVKNCCSSGIGSQKCNSNQFCVESIDEYMCVADMGASALIYHPDVYCSYTVIGVISSWDSCSTFEVSPVFMRVSKYIDWIESNIWS